MKHRTTSIVVGLAIVAAVVFILRSAGLPTSLDPDTASPIRPAEVEPVIESAPDVHASGGRTTRFKGVRLPPLAPNETGTLVFRRLDLDVGQDASRETVDVSLVVNARELTVVIQADRAAVMSEPPEYASCSASLSTAEEPVRTLFDTPPTDYVCLMTDEGRTAWLRITNLKRNRAIDQGSDFYRLSLDYDFVSWEPGS